MTYDERIAAFRIQFEPVRKILREYGADMIVESEIDAGVILNRQGRRLALRVGFSPDMRLQVFDTESGERRCSGSEANFRRWLEETFDWSKAGQPEDAQNFKLTGPQGGQRNPQ